MENYTKYKLKTAGELADVLKNTDNVFVLACNKCFKEFSTANEPDCENFLSIAADQGNNVTGSAKVDFLCNKTLTAKKLDELVDKYDFVAARRGKGLMQGIEFSGRPVGEVASRALDNGLILITAGNNVLRFVPPLVITEADVDAMIEKLEKCF